MTFIAKITAAKKVATNKKSEDLNLKSYIDATEWAIKNINDLDGSENEDGEFILHPKTEDRIGDYCAKYQDVISKPTVTVYRAVCVKNKDDDLDLKKLGSWWSFEEDGVGCYGDNTDSKGKVMVVLQAEVAPKYIDWETGFTSFLWYGESQWEAALEPGSPITLTHIDEKKLDKPIKAKV